MTGSVRSRRSGSCRDARVHERRLMRASWPAPARPLAAALAILAIWSAAAPAEPVTDRVLAGHQVATRGNCTFVKISFNIRISYVGHFPDSRGEEVRINVRPLDPGQAASALLSPRESLRPPQLPGAPIKAIEFETARAGNPTLLVGFFRATAFQVGPGSDFQSIVIAIARDGARGSCAPAFPEDQTKSWTATVVPLPGDAPTAAQAPARDRNRPAGRISAADLKASAAAMDEARAALKRGNYVGAVRLFARVLAYPEHQHSAEAQELIGVAYYKNKQFDQARAEYEDYLQRYPSGDGAESVRQRLDALITASLPREEKLRAARKAQGGGSGETTYTISGSASQFYVRDDSFRVLRDPSLPPALNADREDHRVHRHALLSSLDVIAGWGNDQYRSKLRFSGTEEHGFDDNSDIYSVSALFFETSVRDWGALLRLGRQTRSTGGVLGRFDGAFASWQAAPWLRWNVVAGSPVASRRDEPFKDEKTMFGTSVDFGPLFGGLEFSLFAIEQQAHGILDRQAVGAEMRYLADRRSAFATLDYDVHLNQLNAAILSGSWTFEDKSTLSAGIDYRKSPYLTRWNALQGQPYRSLYELLKARTAEEVDQMAIDRTAAYSSATVGYAMPLTPKLQLSFDATAAHIDGTIASFGVDATPHMGNELYLAAQLIGTSLFRDEDMFIIGARFADRQDSYTYVVDLSTRLPLTAEWRINPRLLLSYREGRIIDFTEYSVLPSVLLNYYITRDFTLELEVGARWTRHLQAGAQEDTTDVFFTAGFRYDFYSDGKPRCLLGPTSCR